MELGSLAQWIQAVFTLANGVSVIVIAILVNKKWARQNSIRTAAEKSLSLPRRIMWSIGMGMNEQCISDDMLDIHINEVRKAIHEEMPYGTDHLYQIMLIYKHLKQMRVIPETERISHTVIIQHLCQRYLAWEYDGKMNPEYNMFDPKQF